MWFVWQQGIFGWEMHQWWGLVDSVNLTSNGHQILAFGMSLTRGDWKWHKEVFDLRHFWRFVRGTCFKCKATKCAGPFQYLVRFNPNKVETPSMPNFKTLLLRYVRVQNFENTPRLTTAEFFNIALTLGAGLCFVCMACKQFKHACSIYWLMRVWTSKETVCQSTLYDSWMAAYDGQILYDAHSSSWNMSLGECWCFVDFNPPQFLR